MASLKERMRQLQELKSSVQAKSQEAIEREKELEEIAKQSPVRKSPGKVQLPNADEETTAGETQTTSAETNASPALPGSPPIEGGPSDVVPEQPEDEEYEEVVEEDEEEEVEVDESNASDEEDVEIIEEMEEVEGDTEGIEIEETEEYVEVFESDDSEISNNDNESAVPLEGSSHAVAQPRDSSIERKGASYSPGITNEKLYDEYAYGRTTVINPIKANDDAPMDEMEFLQRVEQEQEEKTLPFDEKKIESQEQDAQDDQDDQDDKDEKDESSREFDIENQEQVDQTDQDEQNDFYGELDGNAVLPVFELLDKEEPKESTTTRGLNNPTPTPSKYSQRVAPADMHSETGSSRQARGLPREYDNPQEHRWKCIVCCLLIIGACAITALVLPFVYDFNEDDQELLQTTASPTISPVPTMEPSPRPSLSPTVSPAPTNSPTQNPTNVPTATSAPSQPPTNMPTLSPIPPPTTAPGPTPSLPPTTQRLGNFINVFLVPRSGEEPFQNPNSPQFKAAEYIADVDPYTRVLPDETTLAERYALMTFYFATEGDDWNECSLGDEGCNGPWLTEGVCDWQYISCDVNGRVVSITFDGANSVGLIGSIPPEIYLLEQLEDLVIINEPISGTLPERLGAEATNLRQVIIQNTAIGGAIPSGFLSNSPLESFLVTGNNIDGSIPLVGQSDSLTELELSRNRLTGSIPGELASYESLNTLALDGNILVGSIPSGIYDMANLQRLYLERNPLMSGTLAAEIGNMEGLQTLRIGDTGIGGTLPAEFLGLKSLEELDIRNASFRGSLPTLLGNPDTSLRRLHLQDNAFTGTVPTEFGDLSSLQVLNLQGNNLGGSIPTSVCSLRRRDLDQLTVDCDEIACSCCTQCFR